MKDGRSFLAASAGLGGLAWAVLAIAATARRAPLQGLDLLFLLAPLVVVPLALLAALTWTCVPRLEAGLFRALLVLSSTSIVASILLAVAYAWGEFTGRPALDIPRMVRLHGALNAIGFATCGLLAWNVRASERDESRQF